MSSFHFIFPLPLLSFAFPCSLPAAGQRERSDNGEERERESKRLLCRALACNLHQEDPRSDPLPQCRWQRGWSKTTHTRRHRMTTQLHMLSRALPQSNRKRPTRRRTRRSGTAYRRTTITSSPLARLASSPAARPSLRNRANAPPIGLRGEVRTGCWRGCCLTTAETAVRALLAGASLMEVGRSSNNRTRLP